jgi:hypothetical protein
LTGAPWVALVFVGLATAAILMKSPGKVQFG